MASPPSHSHRSAEGAEYDSQGASAKRVAPGNKSKISRSPESGVIRISALQALGRVGVLDQGRRPSRLPLAIIFRAFGAAWSNPTPPWALLVNSTPAT